MLVHRSLCCFAHGPIRTDIWDIKAECTYCLLPVVFFTLIYKEIKQTVCLVSGGGAYILFGGSGLFDEGDYILF